MFAGLKRKVLMGSAMGLVLVGGAAPLFVAHAQGPDPLATESVEAPESGAGAETKGADVDAIQAGPGQQLEQEGGSNLDGNF